jgi:hypothetical protein
VAGEQSDPGTGRIITLHEDADLGGRSKEGARVPGSQQGPLDICRGTVQNGPLHSCESILPVSHAVHKMSRRNSESTWCMGGKGHLMEVVGPQIEWEEKGLGRDCGRDMSDFQINSMPATQILGKFGVNFHFLK